MTIKRKLIIITLLSALLAGIAVFGMSQVAKGGRFHVLNLLHLKHNANLDKQIRAFKSGERNIAGIRKAIVNVRQQPINCLEEINLMDVAVMKMIGSYRAAELCHEDLKAGNEAVGMLDRFSKKEVTREELIPFLEKSTAIFHSHSDQFEAPVNKTVNFIVASMTIFVAAAAIGCIVVVLLISRSIFAPLNNTLQRIKDISEGEGDLTMRLSADSKDEFAELASGVNKFMEKLSVMLGEVRQVAEGLDKSSTDLNGAADQFQTTAQNLASSSEETSAVIEQVTLTIENVHESIAGTTQQIKQVDGSTQEIKTSVTELGDFVRGLNALIQEAADNSRRGQETIQPATTAMGNIRNSSLRISEVTGVIGGISDQVTMLSLNASIEAARAGDLGRGFAVVADEVSKLADKTSHSLGEISNLVNQSETAIEDGVDRVNGIAVIFNDIAAQILKVDSSMVRMVASMQEQEQSIHSIAANINSVRQVAEDILTSSREQKQAMSEINQAVQTVTAEAENVSTGVGSLTHMGHDLSSQTGRLTEVLGHFKF